MKTEDILSEELKEEFADDGMAGTRKESMDKDFIDFGIDPDEVKEEFEINAKFSSKSVDKMTSIKTIAEGYEMALRGRDLIIKKENELYVQKSKALAGESFIQLSGGLLRSFAHESNLMSSKSEADFKLQLIDCFNKNSSLLMRDRSVEERNHRTILQMFKDRLWNVGDLTTNNRNNMDSVFGTLGDEADEPKRDVFGGKR